MSYSPSRGVWLITLGILMMNLQGREEERASIKTKHDSLFFGFIKGP